ANDLRLSQLYGGGGNSGATYTNDFMEIFNAGTNSINLSGYSVQYASSTGSSWQVTNLSGSIGPGQYFLIQQAQGSGGTTPLPTPDVVGTIAMGASGGKAALVNTVTPLTGTCPTGAQIIDFVGFSASANCYEGSGPSPAPSNTTAAIRNSAGCTDTDDNAADFTAGAPTPRNTASPTNSCGVDVPPTVTDTNPADGEANV
ncbi:MAG: lamin tail domain-containing protein, partial [Anaerolineae bacterium]|nr:lamin tail domain-containing protein [Anaerolineae bacterium]